MNNPILKALESELGYYRINEITCPHNPNVDYDTVYNIIYNAYYSYPLGINSVYILMDKLDRAVEEIGLQWMTNRGKFTKRLIKAMPELECIAGTIGDEIQRKAYHPEDYKWLISLSDKIFWDNGNFGNCSSCWWTMYPESRKIFIDNGGIALLFHRDANDRYNGYGRTWILPISKWINNKIVDGLALFNQYGEIDGKAIRLHDTARYINSIIPDTDNQDVGLYNDDDDYNPYINDNRAVLIKYKSIEVRKGYGIHLKMGGSNLISCYECSDEFYPDDMREYRHRWYCESCYYDMFDDCYHCGQTEYQSDMIYYHYAGYCKSCFNELFTLCDQCGNYHDANEITEMNGNYYCESCFQDNFTICEDCNEYIPNDEITEIDGLYYCNDCIPELETT